MEKDRGAVVVEAVISMTTFVFTILTILFITDIAETQSKMAVALNSAAKEISQYCFLYYKFQLDKPNASLSQGTEEAEETVRGTVDGLGQMMDSFGEAGSDFEDGDFDSLIDNVNNGVRITNETVSELADKIAQDPKDFIVGMGKLAGREAVEGVKVYLGQIMAKAFMKKNLKACTDDDPDAFLRRRHVVDGMKGLSFHYSSLMAYGQSNDIQLVCTYRVRMIRLLNIDFAFTFRQIAQTQAWGDGVSVITPRSIWTSMEQRARGRYIVGKEKEGYTYTSTGNGFDAYVPERNEFVTIISMDPTQKSYLDAEGIFKNRLRPAYNSLHDGVSKLGNPITVEKDGEKVTLDSDPATRTYKILLVIPEGTSSEYKQEVEAAIQKLRQEYPGVSVSYKEGYGSLPAKKPAGDNGEET